MSGSSGKTNPVDLVIDCGPTGAGRGGEDIETGGRVVEMGGRATGTGGRAAATREAEVATRAEEMTPGVKEAATGKAGGSTGSVLSSAGAIFRPTLHTKLKCTGLYRWSGVPMMAFVAFGASKVALACDALLILCARSLADYDRRC